MAFEDEVAYALASWERFGSAVTDELTRAVTSAFALVAVADGDLARAEIDRFALLLRERASVLAPLDMEQVELLFRDLGGALMSDPAGGRAHALAQIEAVAGDARQRELVRAAAEIAVAADQRSLAAERRVLGEICGALGVAPR